MVKCPKCGAEIDHLDVMVTERNLQSYRVWHGFGEFEHSENIEFGIDYWKCPVCYSVLDIAHSEDAAQAFLAGEEYEKVEVVDG